MVNSKNLSHFKRNCSYCKSVFFTNVPNKEYCSVKCRKDNYLPKEREYRSKHTQEFRRKVMGILCNGKDKVKCQKCGFSDIRALVIDHIRGDGHLERKANGYNNKKIYYNIIFRLTEKEAKAKYQVLCYNCNQIKVHENHEICGRRKYE